MNQQVSSSKNKFSTWLLAARPKTLWAAATPVVMAASLAFRQGISEYWLVGLILTTAAAIQILSNLVNDYLDGLKGADLNRVGPVRVTSSGLLSPSAVRRGIYSCLLVCLVLGLVLVLRGGWPILLIGVLALLCAVWYSYGSLSLSYTGLADIFVFTFFGPIATAGTFYLLTLTWSAHAALLGVAPGLISIAILTVNNARDYANDLAIGKKTLAVRFGLGFAKFEYVFCLLAAILIPPLLVADLGLLLASCVVFVLGLPISVRFLRGQSPEDFMPLLPKTAKLLAFYMLGYVCSSAI